MSDVKKTIRIQQVKSGIGFDKSQKATLKGLGFGKLNKIVERPDDSSIRGMVHKVRHLVKILD
jgi:large subunit ribosomal protein L30